MKVSVQRHLIRILLSAAVVLAACCLWSCGDGHVYHGGYSTFHGPPPPAYRRNAWEYDRYYRRRVNRFYSQPRQGRAVRREAIQRRSTSGRARPRAR